MIITLASKKVSFCRCFSK